MTALVKKQGLSVPGTITRKAGIKPVDLVEFTVRQGTITIHAAVESNESRYPPYTPTKAETAAIRKGRAAYKRGEFVTLEQLHKELDAARRQPGKKITRKLS
jgi:predicted transcriptional regulator